MRQETFGRGEPASAAVVVSFNREVLGRHSTSSGGKRMSVSSNPKNGSQRPRKKPEVPLRVAKSTKNEMAHRVRFAMQLLVQGHQDWEIRKRFKEQFAGRDGRPVSRRSIDRYLARARDQLLESIDVPPEELRSQLVALVHQTLTDPAATVRNRQRGCKLLADLLGLKAPLMIAQTDSAGNDLYREALKDLSREELKVLATAHERMERMARGGSANGVPAGRRNGSA
jgi:hypothetical protein